MIKLKFFKQFATFQMENFEDGITKSVFSAYSEGNSHDLIIKTGEQENNEFKVHRMVLASCSNFLKVAIATATPGTIPVLLLPDIKSSTMKHLLQYMYKGEVQVPNEEYPEFLEACSLLNLKGPGNKNYRPEESPDNESEKDDDEIPEINDDEPEPGEIIEDNVFYPEQGMEVFDEHDNLGDILDSEGNASSSLLGSEGKIYIAPEDLQNMKDRLFATIQKVYERLNVPITHEVVDGIKKSKIILDNNILVNAKHKCNFCYKQITVGYKIKKNKNHFECWKNTNVKKHLTTVHNLVQQEPEDFKVVVVKEECAEAEDEEDDDAEESRVENINNLLLDKSLESKLTIGAEDVPNLQERLHTTIQKLYERSNIPVTAEIIDNIKNSKIIMHENILVNAKYKCCFCQKQIVVGYKINRVKNNFECWTNANLKKHLGAVHGLIPSSVKPDVFKEESVDMDTN